MTTVHTSAAIAGLRRMSARITVAAVLVLSDAMEIAKTSAAGTTLWNDRTGKTRRSIRATEIGRLKGRVSVRGAGQFLEWGTAPHVIRAKNGRALRFVVNGQTIFRAMVHHPGTKPTNFMRTARDTAAAAIAASAEARIGGAIRG